MNDIYWGFLAGFLIHILVLILPLTADSGGKYEVRLVGISPLKGRLEVSHNGEWGTICSDNFTSYGCYLVCKQLGHGNGTCLSIVAPNCLAKQIGDFDVGSGTMWLDEVRCSGKEEQFDQCEHSKWDDVDCTNFEDIGCVCAPHQDFYSEDHKIRLVGHSPFKGRLEVIHKNEWGSICSDGFTPFACFLVCKQLGYRNGTCISTLPSKCLEKQDADFDIGAGPIWVDDMNCTGYELKFSECRHSPWGNAKCSKDQSVGCVCAPHQDFYGRLKHALRLVGTTPYQGRLEIYHRNEWGTICEDDFNHHGCSLVCNHLGFMSGRCLAVGNPDCLKKAGGDFEYGSGRVWLTSVNCSGTEKQFEDCPHSHWGKVNCTHDKDVGCQCGVVQAIASGTDPTIQMDLKNVFYSATCTSLPLFYIFFFPL